MNSIISANLIYKALESYKSLGYKLVDVPMLVEEQYSLLTKPKGKVDLFHSNGKVYVASAEQSFIQMFQQGKLRHGKYAAITPCYRDEGILDDIHFNIFLKIELIDVGGCGVAPMINDAQVFLYNNTNHFAKAVKTNDSEMSYDLEINNIEVGSYGVRYMPDGTPYVYGTGLAEPRTSYACSL